MLLGINIGFFSLSLSSMYRLGYGTRCTTGSHLGGGSQYGSISEAVAGDRDDNFLVARCLDVFRPFGHGQRQMDGSSPPEVDYNVTILGIAALQSRVTNFRDDELSPLTVAARCFQLFFRRSVIKCRFTLLDSKLSAGYK